MSNPKQINVPTPLLDAVCKVILNKSKKNKAPGIYTVGKPPVIQKMISTEEWLKKEEARKAEEARIQAKRQSPKLEISIISQLSEDVKPKRIKRTEKQRKEYYKQYYFKHKERYKYHSQQRQLKLSKAKIDPFNGTPQS